MEPSRGAGSTQRGIVAVLVVIGLLGAGAYFTDGFGLLRHPKPAEQSAPALVHQGEKIVIPEDSALRQRLAVAPVSSEAVGTKLVLPGIVEADPARTAAVLTPLGGRLVTLNVSLGDRVAKGQVVAVIDSPDLAQAFDDAEKAKDVFDLTEKNLKRQEEQVKIGAASVRDLDQARSDHAQAEAEYRRAQARLAIVGAAGAKPGDRLLTVRAPVAGSVTVLSVAPGNMINDPTQPLMTIADLSSVWVTALVPEKDIASVGKDRDAEIVLAAYPEQTLRGEVAFLSDVIEPDSRRNKLRISLPNPEHLLKPNMFATVTVSSPVRIRLVLPTSALLMNNDRISVFVATAPWTFERRTVQAQLRDGGTVPIDSGLAADDQVVVRGGILLND